MKHPLEADEQKALVNWLKKEKLDFFAPMNENIISFVDRKMTAIVQNKAKAMGFVKGVPDIIVFLKERILFIELKRVKGGKLSDEQKKFLGMANEYGYATGFMAEGWEVAKNMILYYKGLEDDN